MASIVSATILQVELIFYLPHFFIRKNHSYRLFVCPYNSCKRACISTNQGFPGYPSKLLKDVHATRNDVENGKSHFELFSRKNITSINQTN